MRVKEIPLTQGRVALVDEEDLGALALLSWSFFTSAHYKDGFGYAVHGRRGGNIFMHRVLLSAGPGQTVDHINGDGLDNRRCNLRLATRAQQRQNLAVPANNVCAFKGVRATGHGTYRARISVPNGKRIHLGCFKTAEEAALAYNQAARLHFGAFARLNQLQEIL
jgi:hypothetical protein